MVLKFVNGVDVKDRMYGVKTYKSCFVGNEAVTWISDNIKCSRDEAVAWGQKIFDRG